MAPLSVAASRPEGSIRGQGSMKSVQELFDRAWLLVWDTDPMSAFQVAILSARGDYYCEHRGKRQCCCELFHHILGPAHDILLMLYELVIFAKLININRSDHVPFIVIEL